MPITYYFRIMFYRSFYFVIDRGFFPPRRLERRCPRGRINILFLLCQTAVRALFFDVRSRVPSRFSRVMSAVESCSFRVSPPICRTIASFRADQKIKINKVSRTRYRCRRVRRFSRDFNLQSGVVVGLFFFKQPSVKKKKKN